jgi:hypothetical protein
MTELWYRFNVFAERQFFDYPNLIDGIVVPAHVLAYYEVSFSQFLKDNGLPYLMDPITYVWGISPHFALNGNGELKKSYAKYVEKLDCKIGNILGKETLYKEDYTNNEFNEFIEKILRFELMDFGSKKPQRLQSIQRLKERIRLIEGTTTPLETSKIKPYALIPPYFYFKMVGDRAYQKTLYAANYALSHFGSENKVFACVCFEKAILHDRMQIKRILQDFEKFDGVIYWINDLEESTASLQELKV